VTVSLLSRHAVRAQQTYSAAADHYCLPALSFWDRWGAATVSRLAFAAGDEVLDLCCGAGASAIPAARAVGPAGRVLAIDLAGPLLEHGRARASEGGIENVEFRQHDATRTGLPDQSYDAVMCVFGVFFAADMAAFVGEMWRLVRPGGVVAITTWGPGFCEPANSRFWDCVQAVEPSLVRAFNPWDEITTPAALEELFARAGIAEPVCEAQPGVHRLGEPADFWHVVLGSGYRATVEALGPERCETVRTRLIEQLRADAIATLGISVVFGAARRPA
jgi:ubiquinone/menaquinone biosynthesis C-methylase UbiE